MALVNKNETILFTVNLILSLLVWLFLIHKSVLIILAILFLGWLLRLFVQSLLIAYIKGDGVQINEQQFPDLNDALKYCCEKLSIKKIPNTYIINGHGILNAFATHFLRSSYLILHSDIIDALEKNPKAINFYIGHELGHIKRKHLLKNIVLFPANILPILGQAYSRSCEYTCDLHGLACSDSLKDAQIALSVLASGRKRWQTLNMTAFMDQSRQSGKFWMAFNELTRSHPWLSKRCAYLNAMANNSKPKFPRRNVFSYLLALCIPNITSNVLINLLITGYLIFSMVIILFMPGDIADIKGSPLNQQNNFLQEKILNNK